MSISGRWHKACIRGCQTCDAVENMNAGKADIVEIGESDFESEVLKAKQPVLVAFLAPWSQPCRTLRSVLDEVVAACGDRVKVLKVNADNYPDLGVWYDIGSIPTLLCFVNRNVCARIVGTVSKETILAKLGPFLPTV